MVIAKKDIGLALKDYTEDILDGHTNEYQIRKAIVINGTQMLKDLVLAKSGKFSLPLSEKISQLQYNKIATVLGIHFIDEVTGRLSDIFICNENSTLASELANSGVPINKSDSILNVFPKIWLRVYKKILKTNTSLINAFYDQKLPWRAHEEALHICWNKEQEKVPQLPEGVHTVNICFDLEFIEDTKKISKLVTDQIIETLAEWDKTPLDELSEIDQKTIVSKVIYKLEQESIEDQLEEIQIIARRKILKDSITRNRFFQTLKQLKNEIIDDSTLETSVESTEKKWDNAGDWIRNDESWSSVRSYLEAIQSSVFNYGSFSNDSGILINFFPNEVLKYLDVKKELSLFLLTVYDFENFRYKEHENLIKLIRFGFRGLKDIHSQKMKEFRSNNTIRPISYLPKDIRVGKISDKIQGKVPQIKDVGTEHLKRWLEIVAKLSKIAVHERKQIDFLIGIGPAHFYGTKFKEFELSPDELISREIDPVQIIHFIKAYGSLFSAKKQRIIWFDELSHFIGIFEFDGDYDSILGYKADLLFLARIPGKDRFEIIFQNNENGKKQTSVIRVHNESISANDSVAALDSGIEDAINRITEVSTKEDATKKFTNSFKAFAQQLVNETKIRGIGTSYIFVNMHMQFQSKLAYKDDDWRIELTKQSKSLTKQLRKYKIPLLNYEDFIDHFSGNISISFSDTVIEEIIALAELDGSIIIRIDEKGLFVTPNQFAVPLISDEEGKNQHFDYYTLKAEPTPSAGMTANEDNFKIFDAGQESNLDDLREFVSDSEYAKSPSGQKTLEEIYSKKNWTFLNSAGTRHHSLWGISLTSKEPLFVVTFSEDGDIRIFWNGLILNHTEAPN